jgi:hypothetical protein
MWEPMCKAFFVDSQCKALQLIPLTLDLHPNKFLPSCVFEELLAAAYGHRDDSKVRQRSSKSGEAYKV